MALPTSEINTSPPEITTTEDAAMLNPQQAADTPEDSATNSPEIATTEVAITDDAQTEISSSPPAITVQADSQQDTEDAEVASVLDPQDAKGAEAAHDDAESATTAGKRASQASPNPQLFQPEGKDYIVDLTNKDFPCIRRGGRKLTSVNGNVFNLPEHLSIKKTLGNGAYSVVVEAEDEQAGADVAIKKTSWVFARDTDGKRLLREVKLMRGLNHTNIVKLRDILVPTETEFNDLYVVTERMDFDLYQFQARNPLPELGSKAIFYQILKGLAYIHSANVVHRDLKPDNVLLRTTDGTVKICDFNLSRGLESPLKGEPMTNDIATKWYRSPEILLRNSRYTTAVDIWSAGCIFAEMLTGKTLFPGDSAADMLNSMVSTLGFNASLDIDWLEVEDSRDLVRNSLTKAVNEGTPDRLTQVLPAKTSPDALAFLRRMLQFDPKQRASAEQLLQDPFMEELYTPDACQKSKHVFRWKYDNQLPDSDKLRQLFWREIRQFHPAETVSSSSTWVRSEASVA